MQNQSFTQSGWLRSYYFARAIFSIAWVAAAVLFNGQPGPTALLLVIYPAWDALANLVRRQGKWRPEGQLVPGIECRGQHDNGARRHRGGWQQHVCRSGRVWDLGDPLGPAAAEHGTKALALPWRTMADDPEWCAVGPRRRLHDQPIPRHGCADDSGHRPLCRVRRVLLSAFRNLACRSSLSQGKRLGAA